MEEAEREAALRVLDGQRERVKYYRGLLKAERKISQCLRQALHDSEKINDSLRTALEEKRGEKA